MKTKTKENEQTLSWNSPLPDEVPCNFRTTYTKKFEYAEGKFERFTFCHFWQTGEDVLMYPAWDKPRNGFYEYRALNDVPEKRRDAYDFFLKHVDGSFIGNKFTKKKVYNCYDFSCNGHCLINVPLKNEIIHILPKNLGDIFVFRFFVFKSHVPESGEIYVPTEFKRICFSSDGIWSEYSDNPNKLFWKEENYKKIMNGLYQRYGYNFSSEYSEFAEFLQKYFHGIYIPRQGNALGFYPAVSRDNKYQRKINELNKLVGNSFEIQTWVAKKFDSVKKNEYANHKKFFFCDRLNNSAVVVRMFVKYDESAPFEYGRVFYDSEGVYPCYYKNGVVSRCLLRNSSFYSCDNELSLDIKDTFVEKRYPYMEGKSSGATLYRLILSENYTVFEQLSKLGFDKLTDIIATTSDNNFKFMRSLICYFDVDRSIKTRGLMKNISLADLLSKSQLKRFALFKNVPLAPRDVESAISLCRKECIDDINVLKFIVDSAPKNVNNFIPTIDTIMNHIGNRMTMSQKQTFVKKLTSQINSYCAAVNENLRNRFDNPFEDVFDYGGASSHYYDFYYLKDMYSLCSDVFFKNDVEYYRNMIELTSVFGIENIKNKHDELSKVAKFIEESPEKFEAIRKKYKNFEFEDDDFTLRLPISSQEMIEEGSRMNHCVGTYIKRFTRNQTIILFLRKKSNSDKSYVTIELTPRKELRQVKCKNNLYLSSSKTLAFLEKWIIAKKLSVYSNDVVFEKGKLLPSRYCSEDSFFLEEDSIKVA